MCNFVTDAWCWRSEVAQLARLHGILLRTGTLCNPGAAALHLCFTAAQLRAHAAAGGGCGAGADLIEGAVPAGAVRVSFGWASAFEDAAAVLRFLSECFVEPAQAPILGACTYPARAPARGASAKPMEALAAATTGPAVLRLGTFAAVAGSTHVGASHSHLPLAAAASGGASAHAAAQSSVPVALEGRDRVGPGACLTAIYVYPIKSCAAFVAGAWPLGANGLLLDREWALVDAAGAVLTLKQAPRMAAVQPSIDLAAGAPLLLLVCMKKHAVLRVGVGLRWQMVRGQTRCVPIPLISTGFFP